MHCLVPRSTACYISRFFAPMGLLFLVSEMFYFKKTKLGAAVEFYFF